MLTRLEVEGMRLWRELRLDLRPGAPVVLIGPNSSGKTTVVEALDFLAVAVERGLQEAVYTWRSGPADFFTAGADTLALRVQVAETPQAPALEYALTLRRVGPATVTVAEEVVRVVDPPAGSAAVLLQRRGSKGQVLRTGNTWDEFGPRDDQALLSEVRQADLYPRVARLRDAIAAFRVHPGFPTLPRWALDPRERDVTPRASVTVRPQEQLDRRGLDVINTLYHLQQGDERRWAYLVRQLQHEFPFVERLRFPAEPVGGRIALAWHDRRFPGVAFGADQMSAGMWSFLTLLAAVLTPAPPPVIAFDEPDVHLHPSALRHLVALLEEVSHHTAVVLTSHSTQVLDFLADPAASLRITRSTPDGAVLDALDPERTRAWLDAYGRPSALREDGLLDPPNAEADPA